MAERLKNTLQFTNLAPGDAAVLTHGLCTSRPRPLAPDIIFVPSPDLEVTASNALSVTVQNNGLTPMSGVILVEAWHTIERAFADVNDEDLPVKPFVVVSAFGLGNVAPFVFVFNPFTTPGDNIYNDWPALVEAMQAVDSYKILQFDNTRFGTADTLTVPVAGTVRIHDPLGRFAPNMVGQSIMTDGAVTPANNGPFIVTAFIDANNIEYANAAGVAEPTFNGTWVVLGGGGSTACQIPPGIWDMTMVEWFGFVAPYAGPGMGGIRIEILNGASFENLRKIGGECAVVNLNNLPSRSPVVATANITFELGLGPMGDRPSITNTGTTAFFDMSAMLAGQQLTIRSSADMTGPNACVEMGNSPAQVNMNLDGEAKLRTGSVRGTNPAAFINVAQRGGKIEVGQFNTPTSPFAGSINYGKQQTNNGPNISRRLWTSIPQSVNQQIPVASAIAFTTANLGHNHACEIISAGAINQPLPLIRNLQLTNGLVAGTTPGAINSTGMEVNFKQRGAGSINLWGESPIPAQAAGVDVAGGAFVLVGTTITFTAVTGAFTASMVGRAITIEDADDAGNDGTFLITSFINANSVTWTNASGATGDLNGGEGGTWRVGDTIDGLAAAVVVPAGGARTLLSDGVSNWRVIAGLG